MSDEMTTFDAFFIRKRKISDKKQIHGTVFRERTLNTLELLNLYKRKSEKNIIFLKKALANIGKIRYTERACVRR